MYTKTMVTTVDNPFDPFEEFDKWNRFDKDHGYNTWSFVCRLAKLSDEMTQREIDDELSAACAEIAYYNVSGIHKKIDKTINPVYFYTKFLRKIFSESDVFLARHCRTTRGRGAS